MRNFFQKIPFLRITSLFMAGILFSSYFELDFHYVAVVITVLISLQIIFWYSGSYSRIRIQNIALATLIVTTGIFYPQINNKKQLPEFSRKDYFLAEVCQKPTEKTKTFQTILKIQNRSVLTPEKIIAYFSKKSFDSTIQIGDQLVLLAKPQKIKNQGNPFELDYETLMHKKGIWYSVYLPNGSYLKTGHHIYRLINVAELFRQKLLTILSTQITEKQERSVIDALTLGYREELDPETKDTFASTGAMHVLAVSGLHVGLIYFILSFLLSGIRKFKAGRFFYPVLLILLLWSYAFITGFSASVQRATVMFTFIILGDVVHRPVNIFNSLSASALILMLFNPEVIFEVGFQLSYLAVFGIVLIQPQLAKLISVKNKILKFMWNLFTVSIAAQLATFPLGLFYFNQFPNLFWVSNFLVIPGATIIIWVAFGFFIFSPIPVISGVFAFILKWVTHLMIVLLKILSELPYSVSEGVIITKFQVWIIYGVLAALLIFFFSKRKHWLFYSLILLLCFQAFDLESKIKLLNQRTICVYNSPNHLIHLINGRKNYLICNGNDTISDFEFKMAERVQNQLRLEKPVLITKLIHANFSASDLMIKNNEVQFLNCLIKLPNNLKSGLYKQADFKVQIQKPDLKAGKFNNFSDYNRKSAIKAESYYLVDIDAKKDSSYFLSLQ